MATTEEFKNIRIVLEQFGAEAVQAARENLERERIIRGKKARRVATGKLRDDLRYTFWKRGKKDVVIVTTGEKETRNYADVIDKGRRPNRKPPPLEAIVEWIKIKGIPIRDMSTGRFTERNKKNIEQAANRIRWSIGKKGIEGIHYFAEAIEQTINQFDPKIINAALVDIEARLKADKYIK
jgi:hypothetical protein